MSQHGGARRGAGRPLKWHFGDILRIGLDCEEKWREASKDVQEARLAALPHADDIQARQRDAQAIPVPQRKAWLESEAYEDLSGDIEAWLHSRAGTPFDDVTASYETNAPRGVTVSTKPPRGTRRRIIKEVATETGLSESAVDNLWQALRRFVQESRNSADT